MTWTETTRRHYGRDDLRYASDLRDEEWALIAPYLPRAKRFGRSRTTDLRSVVDALLYLLTTGCQWRMLPKCFPPYSTVQRFFYRWRADGLWNRINHELVMQVRETEGCDASPTAGDIGQPIGEIDRGWWSVGFDAGKKIKGRKRHILTDTTGLLTAAIVHEANIQDRDGAVPLLVSMRERWPWLRHVFADGGYAGSKLEDALAKVGKWTLDIVKRSDTAKGFELLPRRWVVEKTLAWLNRNRRLAKDVEATIESAKTWLMIASVKLMIRRLARQ